MFRSALVRDWRPNFHDATNFFTAFEELCQEASPIWRKKAKGDFSMSSEQISS